MSLHFIISAKGIYRAALLTLIRNFADFKLSRSCVVVNAFLDVLHPSRNPSTGFCGRSAIAKLAIIFENENNYLEKIVFWANKFAHSETKGSLGIKIFRRNEMINKIIEMMF